MKLFQNHITLRILKSRSLSTTSKIIFDLLLAKLTDNPQALRITLTPREYMAARGLSERVKATKALSKARRELVGTPAIESAANGFLFNEAFAADLFKRGYIIEINSDIYKLPIRNNQAGAFWVARKIFWFYSNPKRQATPMKTASLLKCIRHTHGRAAGSYRRSLVNVLDKLKAAGLFEAYRIDEDFKNVALVGQKCSPCRSKM